MRIVISALSGLLFGLGLMVSDMVNPARVIAFLDVRGMADGTWDPTLMFVMGGAMALSGLAWAISYRRARTAFGGPLPPMPAEPIDRRLIGGAALFGIGWGLSGVCPGPALVGVGLGGASSLTFFVAMAATMALYGRVEPVLRARAAAAAG